MRRSAHRSRPKAPSPGQIRLDFGDGEDTAPRLAAVLPIEGRLAAAAAAQRMAAVERSAAEWFELGCELEASAPEEARKAYRRAVEADDGQADAHLNLGRMLHEAGDLRGAERCYRCALQAAPEEATAAFNLGVVLEDQRRADEAIACYERAVAGDPDFHDAYHNLVRLHEQRGDKAAAVRVLKRLRERTR